ncbi:ribbon-helix-helix protein, CopG family [Cupriavidus metallidurans]|uniref:ribbon-helix-helix protein, CopG family n=1 Tax=Cupriavidus metallidurans TaxID=119219 RepID=UPI001648C643|nr:ribbon-helix-helix protein, CopG family [Cupriavidus metallidurans]
MTIETSGTLGRIAECWGETPSSRERRWLWAWLKYFFPGRPVLLIRPGASPVESIIHAKSLILDGDSDVELEQMLRQQTAPIQTLHAGKFFNQTEDFDWVGTDHRQLCWLINQTHNSLRIRIPDAEARFSKRDYLICLIDLALASLLDKKNHLERLHHAWLRHLRDTSYLNWFCDDDDPGRCDFAWQVLETRMQYMLLDSFQFNSVIGQEFRKYPGGTGLKCYFDSLQVSDFEKQSHVAHIKKLWSQRKYRERQEKNKVRQRNFVLPDATIKNLDKLAKGLGVSRTQVLERLIELAVRHGMPGALAEPGTTFDLPGDY